MQMIVLSALGAMATFSIILGGYAAFSGIIEGISATFEDNVRVSKKKHKEAVLSWFFGPCMLVFPLIFSKSFGQIRKQVRKIVQIWKRLMRGFFLKKIIFGPLGAVLIAYQWPVGFILSLFWSLIFSVLFLAFLIVFYLLFIPFFIIDRLILLISGFRNHCHNCNELSIIPQYACPTCGEIHKHLVPNKYGIFHHRCNCGTYMGSTYLTGKGRYQSICPHCGESFGTISTVPFTLQLIGGTSSGKTVYAAALLKEVNERATRAGISAESTEAAASSVRELSDFYKGKADPGATQGRDVTFVSEILRVKHASPIKLEIIDIPGEMFAGETALREGIHKMAQYKYADGFIFLVDPYADGDLVHQAPSDGTQISPVAPSEVLSSFDQYLIAQGFAKTGQMIQKPLSVVVVKSDTEAVKREISIELIRETYNANKPKYKTFDACRDEMVKEYLVSIGQSDLVNNVITRYKNAHFFLASAIGHAPNGQPYAPIGVYEAAEWIIASSKPNLHSHLSKK